MAALTPILKSLSNPNRRRVYQAICRLAGPEGITVEKLRAAVRLKQAALSHHVGRLAAAGLVVRRKDRWWVHCTPDPAALEMLRRFAADPAAFTDGS
jgi:DNA-binding transcriptional ArsR family regulator